MQTLLELIAHKPVSQNVMDVVNPECANAFKSYPLMQQPRELLRHQLKLRDGLWLWQLSPP